MSESIISKYFDQIKAAYFEITMFKYNKSIIENSEVKITIYRVGPVVRIDIKEKNNDTCE